MSGSLEARGNGGAPGSELVEGNPSERAVARIRVRPVCTRCRCAGEAAVGWRGIADARARNRVIALIVTLVAGLALGLGLIWEVVFPLVKQGSVLELGLRASKVVDLAGVVACMAIPIFLLYRLPIRGLLCPECRLIRRWGFGRKIPLAWQERIRPVMRCTGCGYSLVGAKVARCPECSSRFPEEWLVATRLADPEVRIEVEVLPES